MGASQAPIPAEHLREDVTRMVRAQLDIGMDIVSKGELRGEGTYNVYEAIEGFETKPVELAEGDSFLSPKAIRWFPRDMHRFPDFYADMYERRGTPPARFRTRLCVTGPLKLKTLEPLKRDLAFFKNA